MPQANSFYRPHPKDGEGNVFTGVCLFTPRGEVPHPLMGGTPFPGPGRGVLPSQVGGGVPPSQVGEGTTFQMGVIPSRWGRLPFQAGVPASRGGATFQRGYYLPGGGVLPSQVGGYYLPRWGVPPCKAEEYYLPGGGGVIPSQAGGSTFLFLFLIIVQKCYILLKRYNIVLSITVAWYPA